MMRAALFYVLLTDYCLPSTSLRLLLKHDADGLVERGGVNLNLLRLVALGRELERELAHVERREHGDAVGVRPVPRLAEEAVRALRLEVCADALHGVAVLVYDAEVEAADAVGLFGRAAHVGDLVVVGLCGRRAEGGGDEERGDDEFA